MAKIVRTRTRITRIKRKVTTPPRGVVYEPGSRRLTVRYEKKSCRLPTPEGVGMSTPVGGAHMCIGGPHRGLPYAHHPQRGGEKKKSKF